LDHLPDAWSQVEESFGGLSGVVEVPVVPQSRKIGSRCVKGIIAKSMTLAQTDYHQSRIDRAHRRHLSAVKSLVQIRKMGPTVQINIADEQIGHSVSAHRR
jgi:hypothetical protein